MEQANGHARKENTNGYGKKNKAPTLPSPMGLLKERLEIVFLVPRQLMRLVLHDVVHVSSLHKVLESRSQSLCMCAERPCNSNGIRLGTRA
jgi:hypothetical protein